jgi:hypothetical protein
MDRKLLEQMLGIVDGAMDQLWYLTYGEDARTVLISKNVYSKLEEVSQILDAELHG